MATHYRARGSTEMPYEVPVVLLDLHPNQTEIGRWLADEPARGYHSWCYVDYRFWEARHPAMYCFSDEQTALLFKLRFG